MWGGVKHSLVRIFILGILIVAVLVECAVQDLYTRLPPSPPFSDSMTAMSFCSE